MRKTLVTGLDIGTRTIRAVVVSYEDGRPEIVAAVAHPSKGMRHGYVSDIDEVSEAVRETIEKAQLQCGRRIKELYLGVGGIGLESHTVSASIAVSGGDGIVGDEDMKRIGRVIEDGRKDKKNKELLHSISLGYRLDGKSVYGRALGMQGSQLSGKTLFVTIINHHLEDLIAAVEKAGCKVADVAAAPLAASLVTLTQAQKTAGCVLANIGAETVSLIVFEDNLPLSVAVFPLGGTSITNDLALGLQLSLEEAEQIKLTRERLSTASSKRKVDEIIAARLRDIFELIAAHLKKMGKDGLLPAGIILTGGTIGLTAIDVFAKSTLLLPARKLLDLPHSMHNAKREGGDRQGSERKATSADSAWAVAYGLTRIGHTKGKEEEALGLERQRPLGATALGWLKQFLP